MRSSFRSLVHTCDGQKPTLATTQLRLLLPNARRNSVQMPTALWFLVQTASSVHNSCIPGIWYAVLNPSDIVCKVIPTAVVCFRIVVLLPIYSSACRSRGSMKRNQPPPNTRTYRRHTGIIYRTPLACFISSCKSTRHNAY